MTARPSDHPRCQRGPLVSVEGISGAGKTFLTRQLTAHLTASGHAVTAIEDFSARRQTAGPDLGREFLHALIHAAGDDRYLRGGHLHAETLLLLAIKTYDYETSCRLGAPGQIIIEGRSAHTIAVYQSVLMHPGDDTAALDQARHILHLAGQWRPLPDLTILITDDPDTALSRAGQRDQRPFTSDERLIEHRADILYRHLAAEDPGRIRILDRGDCETRTAVAVMSSWITGTRQNLECPPEPGTRTQCGQACRVTLTTSSSQYPSQTPV